jgi:hypothetical protein
MKYLIVTVGEINPDGMAFSVPMGEITIHESPGGTMEIADYDFYIHDISESGESGRTGHINSQIRSYGKWSLIKNVLLKHLEGSGVKK